MKRTITQPDLLQIPPELEQLFAENIVYNSSCSAASQTYYIETRTQGVFVKFGPSALLEREKKLSSFLAAQGLAPEVLQFGPAAAGSYLVTRAIRGEDGIHDGHLAQPRKLASVFGSALRRLHELPPAACPVPDRHSEMIALATANLKAGTYDPDHIPEDVRLAGDNFLGRDWPLDDRVVLHGDYCLPNIILQDFQLAGFVDLGNGGLGGRHYDLYWAIWTLEYNTKSNAFKDCFLEAYGPELVQPELLEYNRLLSGFMN